MRGSNEQRRRQDARRRIQVVNDQIFKFEPPQSIWTKIKNLIVRVFGSWL